MPVWKFRNTSISYTDRGLLECVLAARGLRRDDLQVYPVSPFHLPGMEAVARRLARAAAKKEKVLVLGDSDCDGICGTLIMTRFLTRCGANARPYIPARQDEGYGIQPSHVRRAVDDEFDLIVTVDNGISAFQAAETARALGIDLVVTDHHEPQGKLPEVPIVDPKLSGSVCYREYSGTGIAYLTCWAVARILGVPAPEEYLDLVALATVVDVCPLTGENFSLARRGLLQMRANLRPGLQALLNGGKGHPITGRTLSWIVGPLINSAGRYGNPLLAYRLLSARTVEEAEPLARELKRINAERKNMVEAVSKECLARCDGSAFPLIASPDWPEGVIGIAAGRLVEAVLRPAAVGVICGKIVRFSARSIGEFNLTAALEECQSRTKALKAFGGHKLAAGFSIDYANLHLVRDTLNDIARSQLQPEDRARWIEIDARLEAVPTPAEVERLDFLEPHGNENPEPTFYVHDHAVDVRSGAGWFLVRLNSGLKFFTSQPVEAGERIHTAISLAVDVYDGHKEIIGHAVDVRTFLCARDSLMRQYMLWRRGKDISEWAERIFSELGLERTGSNTRTSLFLSPTFLRFGVVKSGQDL